MSEGLHALGAVLAAVIGLAIIAVIVSKQAQTPQVLTAGGTALSSVVQAAVSPVTASSSSASNLIQGTALDSLLTSGF